ncbi:MAG TPA: ribosome-associated translation inhibitor RaiA [Thauera sp.]|nr:ribosome-associated translation inhibitor RaiA [Thauera sp.]HRA81771.1 ribosome-associated translation inhibitor RaiA [Thauera sp.]
MNLNITGRHVEVTPAIRDYVSSKLDRVIRHFDNVTSAAVILSVEKLKQKAEVTLHVRGKDIFVESDDADLYAAIDSMTDKLDRQVLKYKQKLADHNHESVKHQAPPEA